MPRAARSVNDIQPIVRTRVRVRDDPMGWGWIGVGLLGVIGIAAVVNADRFTEEDKAQKRR